MKNTLFFLIIFPWLVSNLQAQSADEVSLKKEQRIQKRYIHPGSVYLSLSAGWGLTATTTRDPNNFLVQGVNMMNNTFLPAIMYEHGVKNNFFGEVGYSHSGHGVSIRRLVDGEGSYSYVGIYNSHDIHLGAGYRLIGKNNFHYLNFHAGFFTSWDTKRGPNVPSNVFIGMSDQDLQYQTNIVIRRFSERAFGPYLGLSKEVRITKNIRLFGKYIQRFGMNATVEGDFELSSEQLDFVDEPATFIVRGGGAFFTLGFKILLFTDEA